MHLWEERKIWPKRRLPPEIIESSIIRAVSNPNNMGHWVTMVTTEVAVLKEVTTSVCRLWLGSDGIVRMTNLPGTEETIKEAMENIAAGSILLGGVKSPVVVDIRKIKSITKEARDYYSGEETAKFTTACAILVGSPVTKAIGNFYLLINKTDFPLKLFSSETLAVDWLRGFVR
jgi:hypothetical protein